MAKRRNVLERIAETVPQPLRTAEVLADPPRCAHIYDDGRCELCGKFEPKNKWAYKPGQSGNPGGRPKGLIGDALYQYLKANDCRTLKQVVQGAVQAAKEGNPKALAVIRDSVDGRPPLSVDLNAQITMSLAERLESARRNIKKAAQNDDD